MTASTTKINKHPKQARAKARVKKILSSTLSLIIKQGLDTVSTTTIAKAADVPVGSIYQYFEDKDDILSQLYDSAYQEVMGKLENAQTFVEPSKPYGDVLGAVFRSFWQEAKTHPTFRILTRWANSQRSLWEVMPSVDSGLGKIIKQSLNISGIPISPAREEAVLRVTVTIVSVIVDLAIEEQDEQKASAILDELVLLLTSYLE